MDICVATCCQKDVGCLDVLLHSLEKFADLASCNLLVSHNSADPYAQRLLQAICESHSTKSLSIDFFNPKEIFDSQQHAEALNRLIAASTSDHVVFADADVILTSPNWLGFCRQHIDQGCFIVGTPYTSTRMWQGDFPNLWCAMADGKALRCAGLDMRTEHVRFGGNPKAPNGGWVLRDDKGGLRDASWEMANHAFQNKLEWISLNPTFCRRRGEAARLPTDMLSWSPSTAEKVQAGKSLQDLGAQEFSNPETGELFCAHLGQGALYGVGTPRSDLWVRYARMAVDMYVERY